MVQTIIPTTELKVVISVYENHGCSAWIEGEDYRGIAVQADTISNAMRELAISIDVLNKYKENKRVKHVCGLQGFGAIDDVCPACDEMNKRNK